MTQELRDALLHYLGALQYKRDTTFNWIEKDTLIRRINAVNLLLGIEGHEPTTMEQLRKLVTCQK